MTEKPKSKFTLVDDIQPAAKKKAPPFLTGVINHYKRSAKLMGSLLVDSFSLLTKRALISAMAIVGGTYAVHELSEIKKEKDAVQLRANNAFQNAGRKLLTEQGYTVLAVTKYEPVCGCKGPEANKLKFPEEFERASVFTVKRHDSISDVGFVREVISSTGFKADRVTATHFIQKSTTP